MTEINRIRVAHPHEQGVLHRLRCGCAVSVLRNPMLVDAWIVFRRKADCRHKHPLFSILATPRSGEDVERILDDH